MRERGLFPQDIPVLNVIVSVTSVVGTDAPDRLRVKNSHGEDPSEQLEYK